MPHPSVKLTHPSSENSKRYRRPIIEVLEERLQPSVSIPSINPDSPVVVPAGSAMVQETVKALAPAPVAPVATTVLLVPPSPATVGTAVTLTATVSPSQNVQPPLTGTMTFSVDGRSEPPIRLTLINAHPGAMFVATGLSIGTHQVTATYSGDAHYSASSSSETLQVVAPPAIDGPQVVDVTRQGFHLMPTMLVVSFNGPLDPIPAQNTANYQITGPTGRIPVISAVYDPSALTVTLTPRMRLNTQRAFTLTINGQSPTGLTNPEGVLLDGNGQGSPGVSFSTILGQQHLLLGVPRPKFPLFVPPFWGLRYPAFWVPVGSKVGQQLVRSPISSAHAMLHPAAFRFKAPLGR